MATRARTAPADGRRPAPLFTVVVGLETLVGPILELFNRTVLTPGTVAPFLTEADVERIVFDGRSRVLDVGPQRRFFRGALRRGIEVRDRTCFHPSCDEVPERPEVDHIHEASKGGQTTQDNGRLGCGFHNRWRYRHPDPDDDPDPPVDADRERASALSVGGDCPASRRDHQVAFGVAEERHLLGFAGRSELPRLVDVDHVRL